MSNQKSGLRFRIPSWFAPASTSSSQPPQQKSSNKSPSNPPPTTNTKNTSSAVGKKVPPPDEVQNGNKSRTGTSPPATQKPPTKPAQKLQSQKSKPKANSMPHARKTSPASPDKSDSPTKLKTQQPSPKDMPVQPALTTPPRSPSTSPPRPKPKEGSDHGLKSGDEVVSKSSPPNSPPMSTTQLVKPEPNSLGELKPTNEIVSKPSSPEKSPQFATKQSSQNSDIDGEPVTANSSNLANILDHEIPGQPKEQIPNSRGDSESPIPTPGSVSSNTNYELDKIPGSQLKPELAKEVEKKVEEEKDKEVEKEKNVITVAVQQRHSNGETKKNVSESPNQTPTQKESNGGFLQEHDAACKGKEFPHNKVTRYDKPPQVGRIKTSGDEGRAVSVITLAGENRGASMEIGSGSSSSIRLPIHRGYRAVNDKDETNEETPNKRESKKTDDYTAADTHINSNIQGINNSIMFNSSITERDPGVHVVRSNKTGDDKKKTGAAAHKAEFNATKAQKHTYEPPNNIRRRCLRGLLLESSGDSDQEKPRRHGCRVPCNQVDIL